MNLKEVSQIRRPSPNRLILLGTFLAISTLMGCGTGAYEALVNQRLEQLKREAPYAALNAPSAIENTGVKIAVPKVLARAINLETPDPAGLKGKVSPERVKFANIAMPGTYVAYDAEVPAGEGFKSPVALQIAIFPKSDPKIAELPQQLGEALKKLLGVEPTWEEVQADSLSGAKVPWKVLRFEGELLFDQIPDDPNAAILFRKMPAKAQLWWHESEPYHTFLFWRIPATAEENVKLLELAPLSAGLITVEAPPAAAEAPPAAEN